MSNPLQKVSTNQSLNLGWVWFSLFLLSVVSLGGLNIWFFGETQSLIKALKAANKSNTELTGTVNSTVSALEKERNQNLQLKNANKALSVRLHKALQVGHDTKLSNDTLAGIVRLFVNQETPHEATPPKEQISPLAGNKKIQAKPQEKKPK